MPGSPFYHYVIVRADLPRGLQAAQICHAAGESTLNGAPPEGTHAVVLQVDDEDHLLHIAEKIWYAEIPHTVIYEPDLPNSPNLGPDVGQATAIGIVPARDRSEIRKVLGRLPLLR